MFKRVGDEHDVLGDADVSIRALASGAKGQGQWQAVTWVAELEAEESGGPM